MAIDKAPAYQMYARDWLGSRNVRLMQDFQRGWYIQLLNEAWDNDPQGMLPNDQEMLMQLAGVSEARKNEPAFNQRWAAVMERFEVDGAWVFNAKQLTQVADQIAYRERQSRAGSASAKIRAERKAEVARLLQEANAGSAVVQPPLNGGSIPVATGTQPDLNSPPAPAPPSASAEKHAPRKRGPQAEPAGVRDSEKEEVASIFEKFYAAYPRKKSRPAAERAWAKQVKTVADTRLVAAGLRRDMAEWNREGRPIDKTPYPATWINAKDWRQVVTPAAPQAETLQDREEREWKETLLRTVGGAR